MTAPGIWALTQRGYSGVLHLVDTTDPAVRQTVCKPHRLTGPVRSDAQVQRDVLNGVKVCKRCTKAARPDGDRPLEDHDETCECRGCVPMCDDGGAA
jgi:hypothetical protein